MKCPHCGKDTKRNIVVKKFFGQVYIRGEEYLVKDIVQINQVKKCAGRAVQPVEIIYVRRVNDKA